MTENLQEVFAGSNGNLSWTKDTERLSDDLEVETISFSDGLTVQHVKDGETIIKRSDGSVVTIKSDGGLMVTGQFGEISEINAEDLPKMKINVSRSVHEAREDLSSL